MPRTRRSVTTISGLPSVTLPTVKLANRCRREASLPLPNPLVSIGGSCASAASVIPIARAVAAESVVRCAPVSIVAVILRLSSRTGKNTWSLTADRPILISASRSCPVRRAYPFLVQRHSTIRQIEIEVEFAEHIGSEDAVNLDSIGGSATVATLARRHGISTPPIVKLLNSTSRLGNEPPTPLRLRRN